MEAKGQDLIRLNRYLLEDAYRSEIRRNRPPEYQVLVVNVAEILEKGLLDKDPSVLPNDTIVVPDNKRTNSKVSVMTPSMAHSRCWCPMILGDSFWKPSGRCAPPSFMPRWKGRGPRR